MATLVAAATRFRRGILEIGLLAMLYLGYSAARLLASDDLVAATSAAADLLTFEQNWGLSFETALNTWFTQIAFLGLVGSYFYATAHYIVTACVLVGLYLRGHHIYVPARRAIVLATAIALTLYLLIPMAPPRLMGYTDVLALHSADGWWGGDASAPRGLGGYTNQLAAMPSMHAGWALWVAIVVRWAGFGRVWCQLAAAYAGVTAVVIIGTGNHWVLDAVFGWLVVAVAAWVCRPRTQVELTSVPGLATEADGDDIPPAREPVAS